MSGGTVSSRAPRELRVLGLFVLAAASASAQSLTFRDLPASVRLAGRTAAVTVERLDAAGLPITTSTLTVVVSTQAGAQVSTSPSPAASWGTSVSVDITAGNSRSPALYLRSGTPGPNTWTAAAPGFASGVAVLPIRHDALTSDAENGSRLDTEVPAGPFNTFFNPSPSANSLTPSMAAAHRGSLGLRLIDGDGLPGARADVALYDDGAPYFGDYFARAWVRVSSTNAQGSAIIVQLTNAQATAPSVLDLIVRGSDRRVSVAGFEVDGGYSEADGDAGLSLGSWHLLEVAALGVGTRDGGRAAWVDGRRVASMQHLDFSAPGLPVARIAVGEPYARDRRWTGTIDFDDVRSAAVPFASRLSWAPPQDGGFVGECLPLRLELRAAYDDRLATVPEVFSARLDGGPGTELFEDSSCSASSDTLTFAQGTSGVIASVRPGAPLVLLTASAADFLPAGLEVRTALAPALVLSPQLRQVAPGGSMAFAVSGGTGRGVGFRLTMNASGAQIDAAGRYTAGPAPGVDEVEARDSAGQVANARVEVVEPVPDGGADAGATDAGATDGGEPPDAGADAGSEDAGLTDAGPRAGPPPRRLGVGCGCASGQEGFSGALLALLLRRRLLRRRKVSASPSSSGRS